MKLILFKILSTIKCGDRGLDAETSFLLKDTRYITQLACYYTSREKVYYIAQLATCMLVYLSKKMVRSYLDARISYLSRKCIVLLQKVDRSDSFTLPLSIGQIHLPFPFREKVYVMRLRGLFVGGRFFVSESACR